MTQEQKAKAYDEAIERAREYWETDNDNTLDIKARGTMEYLFPELRESEDERIRNTLIRFHKSTIDIDGIKGDEIVSWLEKQGTSYTKRDVNDAYVEGMAFAKDELEKQKPTWSEEDEKMVGNIRSIIEKYAISQSAVDVNGDLCEKIYIDADNWLKSLKQRHVWKPTEEQMKALHDMNLTGNISYAGQGQILIGLYNDLKKL